MSDCAYSDPKLKKVHYHLHYKKDTAQVYGPPQEQATQQINQQATTLTGTQQVQAGGTQRAFNTGFVQVDTSPIETIDINQKLLAERDSLRYRIIDLEEQLVSALETQKIEIIRTLEQRYSEQLRQIEVEHTTILETERNQSAVLKQQLSETTAQNTIYGENISSLKQTLEKFELKFEKQAEKNKKEKDQIKKTFQEEIEKLHYENLALKEQLRENIGNNDKQLVRNYEEQINNVKAQLSLKELRVTKLEQDNQNLEQQIHQNSMEISGLQTQIKIKSQDYDRFTLQRKTSEAEKQIVELKRQYEKTITNLEEKIDEQKLKIQKLKLQLTKIPIKSDPVIIERPVQVETVVENVKYVPVERVRKEYSHGNGNSVLLAQNEKKSEKEFELIKHYEDIIEKQQLASEQQQRKIETLTKIHNLSVQTQSAQEQQSQQINEAIRKIQQENDFLRQSLSNYDSNLKNITQKYDESSY